MVIDFVITWVDGSDPEWQAVYREHKAKVSGVPVEAISQHRFRDWDNLRFWFRSVEKFCPWVNAIHFVTCGHFPEWLRLDHPKLNIVRHEDIIPGQFLPTFNSRVIEIYLHKIRGLSDRFVYFNDDFFVVRETGPEYYFVNGLPCDSLFQRPLRQTNYSNHEVHVQLNSMSSININFRKSDLLARRPLKFFNFRYPLEENVANLVLSFYSYFPGFSNPHLPQPYLKSSFEDVWDKCSEILLRTSRNRFRSPEDVNAYLMRYWALAKGDFHPVDKRKYGKYLALSAGAMGDVVAHLRPPVASHEVCLNDCEVSEDIGPLKEQLNAAFSVILGERSSFEVS